MKVIKCITAIAFVFSCTLAALPETPEEMGTRLMKFNDDRPVFEKVKAKGTLSIYGRSGELKFTKVFIMGTYTVNMGRPNFCEKYLASCIAPADEQGNSYLVYHYKNQEDVKYVYLKGIRKAKKVTGVDKKLSFFGSDFTNTEAQKPNFLEWKYKYLGEKKVEYKGKIFDCYMVEALPKTSAIMNDQGCGRRVAYFEKKTHLTLLLDIYDENMIKVKELRLLSFTSKNNIKGQKVNYETGIEMKNITSGTKTHLIFTDCKFEEESNLQTDIFNEQHLTRKWW